MSDERTAAPESREETPGKFVSALGFVASELEATEPISNLSVECLVTLAILRIVRSPDAVRVNVTRAARMIILEYDVRTEDIGQVIGKGGHTIDAIRSLSKSAAGSTDIEYVIYLLEEGKPASVGAPRPRRGGRGRGRGRR
jgi:predicted RNA-binding protein YlqC (UPF0109 family)